MSEPQKEPSRLLVPGLLLANIVLAGTAGYYEHLKATGQIHSESIGLSFTDMVIPLALLVGVAIGAMLILRTSSHARAN